MIKSNSTSKLLQNSWPESCAAKFATQASLALLLNRRCTIFQPDFYRSSLGICKEPVLMGFEGVNLELSPLLVDIFRDGLERYGLLEWSSSIIKRLEEQACVKALGQGFAALLVYDESAGPSHEVTVQN